MTEPFTNRDLEALEYVYRRGREVILREMPGRPMNQDGLKKLRDAKAAIIKVKQTRKEQRDHTN